MAVPEGVEPPTFALGNRCSIRLSYGTGGLLWHQIVAERKVARHPFLPVLFPSFPLRRSSRGCPSEWKGERESSFRVKRTLSRLMHALASRSRPPHELRRAPQRQR